MRRTLKYLKLKHLIILSCTKSQETKQKSLNYYCFSLFTQVRSERDKVSMAKTGIMSSRPDVMQQQWRKKNTNRRTESERKCRRREEPPLHGQSVWRHFPFI